MDWPARKAAPMGCEDSHRLRYPSGLAGCFGKVEEGELLEKVLLKASLGLWGIGEGLELSVTSHATSKITTDEDLCDDASTIFNMLSGYTTKANFKKFITDKIFIGAVSAFKILLPFCPLLIIHLLLVWFV